MKICQVLEGAHNSSPLLKTIVYGSLSLFNY